MATEVLSPSEALAADFKIARKRIRSVLVLTEEDRAALPAPLVRWVDAVATEFSDNVFPGMLALAENQIEAEGLIDELADQQESYLEPELVILINATIEAGSRLADELRALQGDDLWKKRVGEMLTTWDQLAETTTAGVLQASEFVEEDAPEEEGAEDSEEATGEEQ